MNNVQIGLLGPDGTHTAEAGINYIKRAGINPKIRWYKTIDNCVQGVDNEEVAKAVIPILNSTTEAAWVNETLKNLRSNGVMIYDEEAMPIRHHLAAAPGTRREDIRYIHSKDKAFQQCRQHLLRLFAKYEQKDEDSTAAAAEKIMRLEDMQYRAAIVPVRAVELYGLRILKKDIQDDPENKTKFIVISKHDHEQTGDDKTTIIFEFKDVKRPCLLYYVLKEIAERGISLEYIQSIPKKGKLDEFTFYMDIHGHRKDKNMGDALKAIEKNPDLSYWRVLGSYPVFRL